MSFQTNYFQAPKDSVPSSKGEISFLLQEIDNLESKKQELLKTLSLYSSSISSKTAVSDTSSIKSAASNSNSLKSASRALKNLSKDLQKTTEDSNYDNKATIDGANKPSHLYMALAKYLFYDQNNMEYCEMAEDEEMKPNTEELFQYEQKLNKAKSFDNESLESVSTKDNFSISHYENSNYKESYLNTIDEEKLEEFNKEKKQLDFIWNMKNQKLLCKYAEELNNDWKQIAEKFNNKKVTPKMVKDHISNKDNKLSENNSNKRTRSRFTLSEDQKIISMIQKIGQNWRDISKALPGRTEGMVKNRFYSHIKRKYFALVQNVKGSNQSNGENNEENEMKTEADQHKIVVKEEIQEQKVFDFNLGIDDVMIDEASPILHEEKIKNQENNHEFLAFFDENNDIEKLEFEGKFELNLLKTPETSYNFDDYNNLLKLTPFEREECEKSEDYSCDFVEENLSNGTQKLKIRFLSNKIEDIEQLLQQTKCQINKMYCGEQ